MVHVEAVVSTSEPNRAFLYDTGLATAVPNWSRLAWYPTDGSLRIEGVKADDRDRPFQGCIGPWRFKRSRGRWPCFPRRINSSFRET